MGWDESEINRHNTMNVWVRIAAAEGSDEVTSVLLAAARPQVGAKASEVVAGVEEVFVEASGMCGIVERRRERGRERGSGGRE